MMIMFWMFLAVDLFTIGIFYAVYGRERKYSEGTLLGVHISAAAAESDDVKAFMERYRKTTKRFYLWNGIAGAAVCTLNFWYVSVFTLVWSFWFVELCVGAVALVYRAHRKLYDLKAARGWTGSGGSRILAADTRSAALASDTEVSWKWHIVLCALILLPCILPDVREYIYRTAEGRLFFVCGLSVELLLAVTHSIILHIGNKIYSEDSEVNLAINRMQKTVWSWMLLACGICNTAAWLVIASYPTVDTKMDEWVAIVYVVIATIPVLILPGGFAWMYSRKKHYLAHNEKPLYIDDDVYWKNGWYNNPNDPRVVVQDWVCSWNYTTNLGRPAGKAWMGIGLLVGAAAVIAMIVFSFILMKYEMTPIEMHLGKEKLEITSGYSDLSLEYEDILDVEILEDLPQERYTKIEGGNDERLMIGTFRGKISGECEMYIYKNYMPVLKISTTDGEVYVNSKTTGDVEKWEDEINWKKESVVK